MSPTSSAYASLPFSATTSVRTSASESYLTLYAIPLTPPRIKGDHEQIVFSFLINHPQSILRINCLSGKILRILLIQPSWRPDRLKDSLFMNLKAIMFNKIKLPTSMLRKSDLQLAGQDVSTRLPIIAHKI